MKKKKLKVNCRIYNLKFKNNYKIQEENNNQIHKFGIYFKNYYLYNLMKIMEMQKIYIGLNNLEEKLVNQI